MQEFSVSDATLPEILAVVATGEEVHMIEDGQVVAIFWPPGKAPPSAYEEGLQADKVD